MAGAVAGTLPSIDRMLNLFDFEAVAKAYSLRMLVGVLSLLSLVGQDEEGRLGLLLLWSRR